MLCTLMTTKKSTSLIKFIQPTIVLLMPCQESLTCPNSLPELVTTMVRSDFDKPCAELNAFLVDWKTYLADVPEYEPARRTELRATDKMFETDKMSAVSDLTDITLNVKGNNVLRNGQKYIAPTKLRLNNR